MGTWKRKAVIALAFAAIVAICGLAMARDAAAESCPGLNSPCDPRQVTAKALNDYTIRVTWTGMKPKRFTIHRAPGAPMFPMEKSPTDVEGQSTWGPTYQFDDATAAVNVVYTYWVCAHFDNGQYCSALLALSTAVVEGRHAPTFLKPEISQQSIKVYFGGPFERYNLIWGEKGRPLPQVENRSGVFDATGTASGRTYTFSVQGYGSGGWSEWSTLEVRVNVPPTAPGLSVERIDNTFYRLQWRGYRDAAMFRIRRGRGGSPLRRDYQWPWARNYGYTVSARSVTEREWNVDASGTERDYELDDTDQLAGMTEYWYEVCAVNVSRQADYAINSNCVLQVAKTLAGIAMAPTDVRAAFVSSGVQINWTANDDTVFWFEVERRNTNVDWKVISPKIATRRDTYFTDTNPPAPQSAALPRILVYRVCAGNVTGRACSGPAGVERLPTPGEALVNTLRILQVAPSRFAKAYANPPMIEVFLTYSGSDPRGDWAYRTDGGAWVTVRRPPMILKPGTAQVTIPSSVFQNSARSVDVLLNNDHSQAIGTIAVMNVDPTVQAPSREPPRVPDAAPKSVPPLQQQAPGKSTGPVFQR